MLFVYNTVCIFFKKRGMKMKLWKTGLLVLACAFMAEPASAEFYVSAGLGATYNRGSIIRDSHKDDYDTSASYSLAVGYDLPIIDLVRIEAEYLHNRSDVDDAGGAVSMNAFMANGYVDIPLPLPLLTPYVGAGIGYARLESDNVMAYQGIIGVDAEIFVLPIIGSLEYRYMETNRPAKRLHETDKYYAHTIMAKIRYEF